jgi:hypothetical protein
LGALAGVLPGILLIFVNGATDTAALWYLLWVLGGAAAGLWRGWKPGLKLGEWIENRFGWERFWTGTGTVNGAIIGTLLGALFWWAIFPVILGFMGGIRLGNRAGRSLWQVGHNYGWERISGIAGSVTASALGGGLAGLVANSFLGVQAYDSVLVLGAWLFTPETSYMYMGALLGGFGGALGGGLSGFLSDLFARLSGLVD